MCADGMELYKIPLVLRILTVMKLFRFNRTLILLSGFLSKLVWVGVG